jgi:undecaprenyl diphosphate synthase
VAGHKKGADSAKNIIKACIHENIEYLTLYTFSSENWQRPQQEVDALMDLFRFYLEHELPEMHENGLRLRFIGDRRPLSDDIVEMIEHAEELTKDNTQLNLNMALSYGSRQEITHAAQRIAEKVARGELNSADINESLLEKELYTSDIPDPELLIRTGGEHRISNYLLWQCAYTEFYFTDILWPEFDQKAFTCALENFAQRERRFGMTKKEEISA